MRLCNIGLLFILLSFRIYADDALDPSKMRYDEDLVPDGDTMLNDTSFEQPGQAAYYHQIQGVMSVMPTYFFAKKDLLQEKIKRGGDMTEVFNSLGNYCSAKESSSKDSQSAQDCLDRYVRANVPYQNEVTADIAKNNELIHKLKTPLDINLKERATAIGQTEDDFSFFKPQISYVPTFENLEKIEKKKKMNRLKSPPPALSDKGKAYEKWKKEVANLSDKDFFMDYQPEVVDPQDRELMKDNAALMLPVKDAHGNYQKSKEAPAQLAAAELYYKEHKDKYDNDKIVYGQFDPISQQQVNKQAPDLNSVSEMDKAAYHMAHYLVTSPVKEALQKAGFLAGNNNISFKGPAPASNIKSSSAQQNSNANTTTHHDNVKNDNVKTDQLARVLSTRGLSGLADLDKSSQFKTQDIQSISRADSSKRTTEFTVAASPEDLANKMITLEKNDGSPKSSASPQSQPSGSNGGTGQNNPAGAGASSVNGSNGAASAPAGSSSGSAGAGSAGAGNASANGSTQSASN